LRQFTVLVVDDEPMLRDIFSEWLESNGLLVFTAHDGRSAMESMRGNPIDLLLSDVRMPGMDGLELVRTVRAAEMALEHAVLISGFNDLVMRDAYDAGVETILQKPIAMEVLLEAVDKALLSREEAWRRPAVRRGLHLEIPLPDSATAVEQGYIAFGRGGFCVQSALLCREGPVRFELEFQSEIVLSGNGEIRWTHPEERLLGVEISGLDEECCEWAEHLIRTHAGNSYIPRSAASLY
jgi:CheY-like chemotaxis protein